MVNNQSINQSIYFSVSIKTDIPNTKRLVVPPLKYCILIIYNWGTRAHDIKQTKNYNFTVYVKVT